jgi:hypothetical protein
MNKQNRILAGILILQLLVGAFVLWPRPSASGGEGQSLFPGVEVDRIVGLAITDADGETIQLAKRPDGWVLPDAGDYPCQEEKVTPLLTKIVGLKADRLVAQTSSSHKRLMVAADGFERQIEFELTDGSQHRLYLGTSPSFGAAHVRADNQDEVYLTSDLSSQDAGVQATAWVDRIYFSVPQEEVVALTLENANGRFEFVKDGDSWTMKDLAAGETLNTNIVESLVNRTASVSLLYPLGKEEKDIYGLQEPKAVVSILTHNDEDGDRTYTLRVGAKYAEDKSYVVASSESPYYVRVAEFTAKDWVEKTRDGFLELPPTPTPAPEVTPEATPGG